jgi:hypothetical protein
MHAPAQTPAKTAESASSQTPQSGFATPQEAAAALIKAAQDYDLPALKAMFGPDGEDLVSSADPVQDKNRAIAFAERAQKHLVEIDPKKSSLASLVVGEDDWPLPIPIIKKGKKWYFDAKTGRREILYRRVGENELDAIQICRGYVEAQEEYASTVHDDSGSISTRSELLAPPANKTGWHGIQMAPRWSVGVAKAIAEGYAKRNEPYHGYYFKVLRAGARRTSGPARLCDDG